MKGWLVTVAIVAGCSKPVVKPTSMGTAGAGTSIAEGASSPLALSATGADPYLHLEDVESASSLAWVEEKNKETMAKYGSGAPFTELKAKLQRVLDSKDAIPAITKIGGGYYNFWKDAKHERGIWRRVQSIAEYKKASPKWETVIDLDALSKTEQTNWVWHGAQCLYPTYDRCLVALSRGGADAQFIREFDLSSKTFLADGFVLPEAKSDVSWRDRDTIYVATEFGPDSLTASGYPRIVKVWNRGTPLSEARTVYEGKPADMVVGAQRQWDHGKAYDWVTRVPAFFEAEQFLMLDGKLVRIDAPISAKLDLWNGQLLIVLRKDWTVGEKTWLKGSCLSAPLTAFLAGERNFKQLFEPSPTRSLDAVRPMKNVVILDQLDNLRSQIVLASLNAQGEWTKESLKTPVYDSVNASPVDEQTSDEYWLAQSGFLTPQTLAIGSGKHPATILKKQPQLFDGKGLEVQQHFAISKDGTRVPYYQVSRKEIPMDGSNPTLLYGYGGFEVSLLPSYLSIAGNAWLSRGGVYVQANIRGGGEYGPAWHEAALREKRQHAYDDFIAVAEDLIRRKVTTPEKLGIRGGSNGGLLMGVMMTERPDLFGAVWSHAPLLDMKRFNKMLAGASWMAEYGNPDKPEDWAFISKYSPYQNTNLEVKYPPVLFTTSTRDDRVHPGHARKMVAKLEAEGHPNVYFWENTEGGHGGAATNAQKATLESLGYTFLADQLKLSPKPVKPPKQR